MQAEAERKKLAGVMAVVDDGGWRILTLRMDNAAYVAWLDRRDEYMQQFCRLLVTG